MFRWNSFKSHFTCCNINFYQILFQNDPFYFSLFLPNIISEWPILFQFIFTKYCFRTTHFIPVYFHQILFQNDPFYSRLLFTKYCFRTTHSIPVYFYQILFQTDPFYSCLKLVIVDNVASVIYPILGGNQSDGNYYCIF